MMKPQRVNDERLQMKNMKNIRFVYAIQTLGIFGVLSYDFVRSGISGVAANPLWIVFILSTVILAFLSMNADERLVRRNLQKIRIAYAIQVIGIIGVFVLDVVRDGVSSAQSNPVWFVFTVSTVILIFLSMNMSVDHETNKRSAGKGLFISFIVLALICVAVGIFTSMSEGFTVMDGVLTGSVFLICGIVPFLFLYRLRKVRNENGED